jgi:hypothetical protein
MPSDLRQSLTGHAAEKGAEVHAKYGPHIGWNELLRLIEDRSCVRYPCVIEFDEAQLQPGEFAHPVPNGARPEAGFTMYVHPFFMTQLDQVPLLVLYQLVLINYGGSASSDDAEIFGATALGLSQDQYYSALCDLADQVGSSAPDRCC